MENYGIINDYKNINKFNNTYMFISTINLVSFFSRCYIGFCKIILPAPSMPLELISGKSRLY